MLEILFGLIMALTITNSIEIAQHGEADVRTLIAGALGCNLAWGVIDAAMYLMTQFGDRGRAFAALRVRVIKAGPPRHDRSSPKRCRHFSPPCCVRKSSRRCA